MVVNVLFELRDAEVERVERCDISFVSSGKGVEDRGVA
jgi:hypothetical protein